MHEHAASDRACRHENAKAAGPTKVRPWSLTDEPYDGPDAWTRLPDPIQLVKCPDCGAPVHVRPAVHADRA